MQEVSPSYEMVLKQEKAHQADVNCVQWHPKVYTLHISYDWILLDIDQSLNSNIPSIWSSSCADTDKGVYTPRECPLTISSPLSEALEHNSNFIMQMERNLFDMSLCQEQRLLASAGDDGTVKIWELVGDLPVA
jgi:hypothetical protein